LSKALISFCTGLLIARGLGPEKYGTMMFLLGTFTSASQFLDMGTSTAFFTFLSQRQRSRRFVGWYLLWLCMQFTLSLLAVGLLFPDSFMELVWRGQQRNIVVLAFLASFAQSVLWSVMLQMGESQRLTKLVQGVAATVAFLHLVLMLVIEYLGWLEIRNIFGLIIFEWIIASVVILKQLRFQILSEESDTPRTFINEFWRYCLPMIPYTWLSFSYEFADRWLLQKYAGGIEQAYYSVALQFSAIASIASASILNIFWKEIAEEYKKNNHERVAILYRKVSRRLFFFASLVAGFLVPWAKNIIDITLGVEYAEGVTTLIIMLFYPIHQTMGQIGGVMAFATGRVSIYVKNGIVIFVMSIVFTYFMLADGSARIPGLALGSFGLACKMVILQVIAVNLLAFFICDSLKIKFDWFFQLICIFLCSTAGWVANYAANLSFGEYCNLWILFPLSASIYMLLMVALILLFPGLIELNLDDLTTKLVQRKVRVDK
jgi:O-antigen/teichoic acid export membrane protein